MTHSETTVPCGCIVPMERRAEDPDRLCPICEGSAHPALKSSQSAVPDGWKLVPRTPTSEMMDAGIYQSSHDSEWNDVYSAWVDMWDMAPDAGECDECSGQGHTGIDGAEVCDCPACLGTGVEPDAKPMPVQPTEKALAAIALVLEPNEHRQADAYHLELAREIYTAVRVALAPPVPAPAPADGEREALRALLDHVDRETCTHEETHRGGFIWTICDGCGRKWADDEGGFVPYADPPAVARARLICEATPPAARSEPASETRETE